MPGITIKNIPDDLYRCLVETAGIATNVVEDIIKEGEVIASYPNDAPFPSALVLGFDEGRPVHVVVGRDAGARLCHVVTVYHPDPDVWSDNFKTRRRA